LLLFDESGKPRTGLAILKDGPSLGLSDENGVLRVLLSVDKEGRA
jgi:hypothetical protein